MECYFKTAMSVPNHKFLRTEPLTEEIDRMKSPEYSSGSVLKPNSFDILMRLFSNAIR